ncbi:hypothetical protein BH09ACT12_BH09ACT12_32310 [soil metagenome]
MTLLVTGASGQLGRLVLDSLIAGGTAPAEIRAGTRRPEALATYAEQGVDVVHLDYDDHASVKGAVAGADRVLLISGSEPGQRTRQHATVIDAAAAEGVDLLVYTSLFHADTSSLGLAPEHRATEHLIAESGDLAENDPTLARLIGRPTTPLVDSLRTLG